MKPTEKPSQTPLRIEDIFRIGGKYPDLPGRSQRFLSRVQRLVETNPVLPTTISNPPTQTEVQQLLDATIVLRDKINEIIVAFYESK